MSEQLRRGIVHPQDEVIYEGDLEKAKALLRAGKRVLHPSVRTREEDRRSREEQLWHPVPDHEGYLYVFAAGIHVKIGISWLDVERRWASILSSNPLLERPLYISPPLGKRVTAIERSIHQELMPFRVSGEWFKCERAHALSVVEKQVREASI